MRTTQKTANGTSFFSTTTYASVNQLKAVLGEPQYEDNTGENKVNFEWVMETDSGQVFTIYDWKEYQPLKLDKGIDFHIGGYNSKVTEQAKMEIENAIRKAGLEERYPSSSTI